MSENTILTLSLKVKFKDKLPKNAKNYFFPTNWLFFSLDKCMKSNKISEETKIPIKYKNKPG